MTGTMRSAAAWLVLAIVIGAAAPVVAAPAPARYELLWRHAPGAEACIAAPVLADVVSARLGRPAFDGPGVTAVVIEGEVAPTATGWHVALAIRGADGAARGARELDVAGADCRAIDEPLALVLALIVDPDAGAGAPPPPPPAPIVAVIDAPKGAPPVEPWRAEAAVTGAVGRGALPGTHVGARLAIVVDSPRLWPVAFAVGWWAPGEIDLDGGRRVRLGRWQARLGVCTPTRSLGRARVAGCAGGEVARIDARAVGFDSNRQTAATLGLAALAARGTVELTRAAFVVAEIGVEVPLTRPRFFDDAGALLYRAAPAAMIGGLGLGVRF